MGTMRPSSIAVHEGEEETKAHHHDHHQEKNDQLDAGALFVLKSKGSWVHCGYHLTTSIVAPPLLSLPYAFTFLGWAAGIACLVVGALVSFYSYNLLSLVLEHHAHLGHRHLRFRDMAADILEDIKNTYTNNHVLDEIKRVHRFGLPLFNGQHHMCHGLYKLAFKE